MCVCVVCAVCYMALVVPIISKACLCTVLIQETSNPLQENLLHNLLQFCMPVRVDVYHASFGSQDNCNSEETNPCLTCLTTKHNKNKLVSFILPQGWIRV